MKFLVTVVLASVFLFTACPDNSKVHQAAQTANGIATTLNNAEQLNESAFKQGTITAADSRAVALYIRDSVQINEQLIAQIRSTKALNPQSAESILAAIDKLAGSVNALQEQGALHIKDPQTQQAFANYVSIVRASIQSARQIIAASGMQKTTRIAPYQEMVGSLWCSSGAAVCFV